MSRIGKATINLPKGVEVTVGEENVIKVKGPKGELYEKLDERITLSVEDGVLTVKRPNDEKEVRALHGLYRSLVNNMVIGVSEGYKKQLELVGVGYKATATGQNLELAVGYSHPIIVQFPKEVAVTATMEKGQNPKVFLESIDKQLLGQVAAKVRSLRKPEPYKGKGIRYNNEFIRRKAGKSASK
jgi:large subunit ribosomal protein L6